MRAEFVRSLVELAALHDRIVLLTGDLGFMALEPFIERFPHRFFNAGVAEQNMVGMATGLAGAGFIPYVYSIATFATFRPFEFIRNGPVLHGLPVRIVGVGAGFEYGPAGPTHHAVEDIAVMRALTGLTVIAPADPGQTRAAVMSTWDVPGPIYFRLGKDDRAVVPGVNGRFALGEPLLLRDGSDVVLVSTGAISGETVRAAELLHDAGISARVVIVSTLSPVPPEAIRELIAGFALVVTLEAHGVTGGLGSLVAEVIAEEVLDTRLIRLGVRAAHTSRTGSQAYLHGVHGLTAETVATRVLSCRSGGT